MFQGPHGPYSNLDYIEHIRDIFLEKYLFVLLNQSKSSVNISKIKDIEMTIKKQCQKLKIAYFFNLNQKKGGVYGYGIQRVQKIE